MTKIAKLSAAEKARRVVPSKYKTARGRVEAVRRATSRLRTRVAIDVKRARER